MTKENRIKKEFKRISEFYKDISQNQREVALPLMQNAAFMKVTLEDLQAIINVEGVEDEYRNGSSQYGTKPSAVLQAYNSMLKNYATVTAKLLAMLPKQEEASRLKALFEDE